MVFWDVDVLNGGDVERMYGQWEGHQVGFHDVIELGERVAGCLEKENPVAAEPVESSG